MYVWTSLIFGCTFLSTIFELTVDSLKAYAWQSKNDDVEFTHFPENQYIQSRPNVAIGFSGGGSRAFVAAAGQISALNELSLLGNIKYIGGISGGAWATIIVSYAQNIKNVRDFLCDIIEPENINIKVLETMNHECIRQFASDNLIQIAFEKFKNGDVETIAEAWSAAIQVMYLDPVGILPNTRFSWSIDTVDDIKRRNPELESEEFLLPANISWPYPIVGITLVGPSKYSAYGTNNHNYSRIDITPLYIGQMKTSDIVYKYFFNLFKRVVRIGGLLESFAFAAVGSGPSKGLPEGSVSGLLTTPEPEKIFDLQFVAGASSFAPASFAESIPFIGSFFGGEMSYWSPTYQNKKTQTQDMFFADGGTIENIPLITFLQRKVKKIILFMNYELPLQDVRTWNVSTDLLKIDQISDAVPSYFGIFEKTGNILERSYDYDKNHVFDRSDYIKVVKALQDAQQQGNGIIATLNLTTIQNDNWGIPHGFTAQITFVYLGRLFNWEHRLPRDIKEMIVPPGNEGNMGEDIKDGPFNDFPHYQTLGGGMNYERSNLLANMVGWSILENKRLFQELCS
mmetsp:Transcript_13113/g.12707  ORF Transcript_13113/g.12707 Transcript_13113/m.12707 type:complete len:569 (-) Transcript_13113:163-1869(-)